MADVDDLAATIRAALERAIVIGREHDGYLHSRACDAFKALDALVAEARRAQDIEARALRPEAEQGRPFDEEALRRSIERVWGPAGAHADVYGQILALAKKADEWKRRAEGERKDLHDTEQILGKALGYPWFKDDPKNFPDATEEDGVCVGEHVAPTLAMALRKKVERYEKAIPALQLCAAHFAEMDAAGVKFSSIAWQATLDALAALSNPTATTEEA